MKYKWKAVQTITCQGSSETLTYVGRDPVPITDELLKRTLAALGTFEFIGADAAAYIGNVYWLDSDGNKISVDRDGFIEIDWDKFTPEEKAGMLQELEETK
jgi:hypothetical protein